MFVTEVIDGRGDSLNGYKGKGHQMGEVMRREVTRN